MNNSIAANHVPNSATRQPEEERGYESTQIPPIDEIDERNRFDRWSIDSRPMRSKYIVKMESKYGIKRWFDELADNLMYNVSDCKRWFESESFRSSHTCITAAAIAATGRSNRWLLNDNNSSNSS